MTDDSTESVSGGNGWKDYVYVAEFGDRLVKVGRSTQPKTRTRAISTGSGRKPGRVWISKPLLRSGDMERRVHENLSDVRGIGEWFKCSFDEAVVAANQAYVEDDLWTLEARMKLNAAADHALDGLKAVLIEGFRQGDDAASERFREDFLRQIRERSIKNCMTWLHYREAGERAYLDAVASELAGQDACTETDEANDIASVLAYSNDSFLEASRIEYIHLGITLESCMLYTQDANKIHAMLNEIEIIAMQRMANTEPAEVCEP